MVVGGDGDPTRPRQVVATASYEARAFGVHSGMPLRTALRKCPDAVFLPSDRPAYDEASEGVMATLRSFPAKVEVWGWDEAFVGEHGRSRGARHDIRARVFAETQLTLRGRHRPDVAAGEDGHGLRERGWPRQPTRRRRLTWRTWLPTMGDRPVTDIWGIGKRIAIRLADAGISTVTQLADSDHEDLARRFGPSTGPYLKVLGMAATSRRSTTRRTWRRVAVARRSRATSPIRPR